MKAARSALILLLTICIILSQARITHSTTESIDDVRTEVSTAFKALVEAYNTGGNITALIERLNEALNITSEAEQIVNTNPSEAQILLSEARALAQAVNDQAPLIQEEGLKQRQTQTIITIGSIVGAISVGVLIYIFGPPLLWKLWLRLKKNCTVRVTGASRQRKGSVITIERVCGATLGIILIGVIFVSAQFFLAGRTGETFAELGILGPQMRLSDYPTEVVAGGTVSLYVYIGNQMGKPVYYTVMVKIGDNNTTVDPAPTEPNMKLERILSQNENLTSPINIKLTAAGLNQRIIFELWAYNETSNEATYTQRWGQIWLNVTAPP